MLSIHYIRRNNSNTADFCDSISVTLELRHFDYQPRRLRIPPSLLAGFQIPLGKSPLRANHSKIRDLFASIHGREGPKDLGINIRTQHSDRTIGQ